MALAAAAGLRAAAEELEKHLYCEKEVRVRVYLGTGETVDVRGTVRLHDGEPVAEIAHVSGTSMRDLTASEERAVIAALVGQYREGEGLSR